MVKLNLDNSVFNMLCVCGCLYQVYQMSSIYFQYQTTTDVQFDINGKEYLPGITFCGLKYQFIRDRFKNIFKENSSEIELLEEINKHSIKEQFEMHLQAEEIVKVVTCSRIPLKGFDTDGEFDCNQVSPILVSISGKYYCFSLFQQYDNNSERLEIDRSSPHYSLGRVAAWNCISSKSNSMLLSKIEEKCNSTTISEQHCSLRTNIVSKFSMIVLSMNKCMISARQIVNPEVSILPEMTVSLSVEWRATMILAKVFQATFTRSPINRLTAFSFKMFHSV